MIQRLLRVALIGALLPATSWALGVGEIQVRSKLNEPLRAEIELIYSDTAEAEGAAVQLASDEDFERVGLDPSLAGNELMFNVVRNDQGNFVIEVTSMAPVVETFLDFLIEVQWENGRLLREYVVLLDPPVTAPSPVQVAPLPSSEPAAPVSRPTPPPSPTTRTTRTAGGGDYTVVRGDTLWEIARDYRPDDSITINQMMVAILRMNPDAFFENNVNALREGAILRMPGSVDASSISLGSANSTVQEHNELFDIYVRSQTGGEVPTISDAGADAEYDPAPGRAAPSDTDSRLELVPPADDTRSVADRPGAGEEAQRMREELARVREDLISARQENSELQDRVGELEELVGSMERAISLKDADLADLEDQLRAAREAEADLAAAPTPLPTETIPEPAPTVTPTEEPETATAAVTEEPVAEEPAEQVPAGAAPPQPQPTAQPITFEEEPGLLSNPLVLGGGALVLLGLGGLGFMLYRRRQDAGEEPSYAASDDDALFAEMGAAAEAEADVEPEDVADEAPADAGDIEQGLLAELADDPDNAQTHLRLLRQYYADENAGKFVAAAATMKEKVGETHPAWMEVRSMGAKLAPADALFGGAEDAAEESGETQIMMTTPPPAPAADLGDDDDLDLDLDLGDDTITDDSTQEIPAQDVPDADADDDFDFDLDLEDDDDLPDLEFNLDDDEADEAVEEAAAAVEDAADEVADELDEGLEFNLDDLDLPGADTEADEPAAAAEPTEVEEEDDMGLDFDLSDIDLPDAAEAEAAATETSAEPDADLEDELPSVDHLNETVEPLSEQESADLDDLELDLEGIGVDLNDTGEAEPLEPAGDRTEFELEALDVGGDAGDVAGMTTAEMEIDLGLDDDEEGEDVDLDDLELSDTELFAGEESAGTKLDLARAYIEMGDPDGARGMLEEVLAEGSDEQKSEAQQLMDGLEG